MNSIKETAELGIESYTKYLEEAKLCKELVQKLPQAIVEFEADSSSISYYEHSKELHITVNFWGSNKEEMIREFLSLLVSEGAVITPEKLAATTLQWYKPTSMTMYAKLDTVSIDIKGSPLPPGCEIVEEDYVGKKYRTICHGQDTA